MGALVAAGLVLVATDASAAYATAFSRATATWKAEDGREIETTWNSAASSASCGTNCRVYNVLLWVNDPSQEYNLAFTYGRLWKNGTNGTDPYYASDFDFRSNSGGWTSEDFSSNYVYGTGRNYYARKAYGTDLSSTYDHEIRFDYKYTSTFSWCQRRINFAWTWIG
jgi:hypothetical protein